MSLMGRIRSLEWMKSKAAAAVPDEPLIREISSYDNRRWITVKRGNRYIAGGYDPQDPESQESIEQRLAPGYPEIAPGKWLYCGHGDYKSVYRPEDGKANYVVKCLGSFGFSPGEEASKHDAQQKAEARAGVYRAAYEIIDRQIGVYLLRVRQVKVGPLSPSVFGVFKFQEYGNLTSAWLLQDSEREPALDDSSRVSAAITAAKPLIKEQLLTAGIEHRPLQFDRAWDIGRGKSVVYDILDGVAWRKTGGQTRS